MSSETLELKTKDGMAVHSNGHGTYSISEEGGGGIKVRYPKSCLSEKIMAHILEQADIQTGAACEWVPGPAVETIEL